MTAVEGIDACGSCKVQKLQAGLNNKPETHVFSRRQRDLRFIMKRATNENEANNAKGVDECPCEAGEDRDACGVCKPIGNKGSKSNICAHL